MGRFQYFTIVFSDSLLSVGPSRSSEARLSRLDKNVLHYCSSKACTGVSFNAHIMQDGLSEEAGFKSRMAGQGLKLAVSS